MLKKLFNKEADDALALLIGGIIIFVAFLLFGVFIIVNITKIAISIAIIGVAILAIGAGVLLLKKALSGVLKR